MAAFAVAGVVAFDSPDGDFKDARIESERELSVQSRPSNREARFREFRGRRKTLVLLLLDQICKMETDIEHGWYRIWSYGPIYF